MGVRGAKILEKLPDIPRWIYARWLILSGQARIYGDENLDLSSSIIQHPTNGLTCMLGNPDSKLIHQAAAAEDIDIRIITNAENDRYIESFLPDWTRTTAHLHILSVDIPDTDTSLYDIRFLDDIDISESVSLPEELRREFFDALLHSPVAAFFVDDRPVSFCYAPAQTESLWDVSVDTLDEYRNKGYAFRTVSFMIERMNKKGKRPVWGAEETNHASLRLARKLGFKPVDTIYLYNKKE